MKLQWILVTVVLSLGAGCAREDNEGQLVTGGSSGGTAPSQSFDQAPSSAVLFAGRYTATSYIRNDTVASVAGSPIAFERLSDSVVAVEVTGCGIGAMRYRWSGDPSNKLEWQRDGTIDLVACESSDPAAVAAMRSFLSQTEVVAQRDGEEIVLSTSDVSVELFLASPAGGAGMFGVPTGVPFVTTPLSMATTSSTTLLFRTDQFFEFVDSAGCTVHGQLEPEAGGFVLRPDELAKCALPETLSTFLANEAAIHEYSALEGRLTLANRSGDTYEFSAG